MSATILPMGRDELLIFASELKKETGVRDVYFFGSRQKGWSRRHNREPLPESDWDLGIIYEKEMVPVEALDSIRQRLGLEAENIEVTQRSRSAASGEDFWWGLFSQDMVIHAILAGERL